MLNDMGSIIDDGVAFRVSETEFYVTATTGAVARVFSEMLLLNAQWGMRVDIQNVTAAFAAINVTGPLAREVLEALGGDIDLSTEGFPYLHGRVGGLDRALIAHSKESPEALELLEMERVYPGSLEPERLPHLASSRRAFWYFLLMRSSASMTRRKSGS